MTEQHAAEFSQAVDLLRQGLGEQALSPLQNLLSQFPQDPALLTNLGIAAAQSKKWGLAMSYLREAQEKGSDHLQTQQAIEFVRSQLPVKEIPHQLESWELIRDQVLQSLSLNWLLALTAVCLLLVGLLALRFINDRRKALLDEEALPRIGFVHILGALLLGASCLLSLGKLIDLGEVRGVILAEQITARSAGNAEAPGLFDLYAGLEVQVKRESGDWLQVRYPGGPIGWIPKAEVRIFHSGYH